MKAIQIQRDLIHRDKIIHKKPFFRSEIGIAHNAVKGRFNTKAMEIHNSNFFQFVRQASENQLMLILRSPKHSGKPFRYNSIYMHISITLLLNYNQNLGLNKVICWQMEKMQERN